MATNNDVMDMLKSIRDNMATKSDMFRLQKEVSELRDENESQKYQIRLLSADITNLRAEVNDFRASAHEEIGEGLEQIKDDVVRWGVVTQEELWEQETRAQKTLAKFEERDEKVNKTLSHIELGINRLLTQEIQRTREGIDEEGRVFLLSKRFDKVQADLKSLSQEWRRGPTDQQDGYRRDSGVCLTEAVLRPMTFGFANGY